MPLATRLACVLTAMVLTSQAGGQPTVDSAVSAPIRTTLGEVLDAGAKQLTAEDLRKELIGSSTAGPSPNGNWMELKYLEDGLIRGQGFGRIYGGGVGGGQSYSVEGRWTIDEDRLCVSMQYASVVLPPRCQFWFKRDNAYYLSDSDSDRRTRVLVRTVMR